jgi:transcriptional regulator with XRE-family HTH domain
MLDSARRPATTYPAIVGGVLGQLRQQNSMRQEELADALGITQSTLSRIEKGDSSVNVEHLRLAAHKLGLTPGTILNFADQAEANMSNQGIAVTAVRNDDALNNALVLIGAVALAALITAVIVNAQKN